MYQISFDKPVKVYFIGIGGISMSGLALVLRQQNFAVSGSDAKESELTKQLEDNGCEVFYGQKYENVADDIEVAVYTAAIHPDNPEYQACVDKNIPLLTRAELLGQLMKNYDIPVAISGTHGKTTTTSMVSEILLQADLNPTLSIGGIYKSIGGNIKIGGNKYFVTEACEYTNSFLSFFPKISIILNIDADHLDFFKDLNDIRNSFHKFSKLLPADGTLIINNEIENLEEITGDLDCRIITFGKDDSADYYATDITYNEMGHATYTVCDKNHEPMTVSLSVPGVHNVYNSLSAIAFADLLEIDRENVKNALLSFTGTDRRFQKKGKFGEVTVIDDYAHHPTEISATLNAAKNMPANRVWCVFQPHTYTRTKALMKEFAQALSLADCLVLADIYPARETDNLGISSLTLKAEIEKLGKECFYVGDFSEIEKFLKKNCLPNDVLITMGAGDVFKIGENLISG